MTSSSEHERHAEEVRAKMAGTAEEIRERMAPGQLFEEALHFIRDSNGSAAVSNLGRQVRDNPLALALIGAGVAWLFAGPRPVRREYYPYPDDRLGYEDDLYPYPDTATADVTGYPAGYPYDDDATRAEGVGYVERDGSSGSSWKDLTGAAKDKVGGVAADASSRVGSTASSVSASAKNAASGVAHAAGSAAETASRMASRASSYAADTAREGGRYANSAVRGAGRYASDAGEYASRGASQARDGFMTVLDREPLVIGAIGLAVGAAVGAMLPSTRIEDETFGKTRDELRDEAERRLKRGYEDAKDVAAKSYAAAKSSADDEGLMPKDGRSVAEKVETVAAAAAKTAKDSAMEKVGASSTSSTSGTSTPASTIGKPI